MDYNLQYQIFKDGRLWAFVKDMNNDGILSRSDFWLWIKWAFFYPGDAFLLLIGKNQWLFSLFELSSDSYGNPFSGIIGCILFTFWPYFLF